MRRVLTILAVLLTVSGTARADGPWSGTWATQWRDGGARLLLDQQGDKVTGSYPLYGGRIAATADGSRLEGRWFEGDQSGSFVFVMGRDGDSFTGRYDTGEWWTGGRTTGSAIAITSDLSSPREVFRRFIVSGNLARLFRPDAWGVALQSIDFGADAATMPRGEQLQRVQGLFAVIDLATFRVWSIPETAPGNSLQVRLDQSGTDATLTLDMVRDASGDWRIRMPSVTELDAERRALLAGRGGRMPQADAYLRLQNPRDTMRSFLEGMTDWNGSGRALALSTLDLSHIPEVLRDPQGALAAEYLRRILNQIGLVGLQSIPDNGQDRTPYVHYSHPAGRIVIAPSGSAPDAAWRFTAETVADADDLFRATDGLPPPLATPPGLIPDTPFFILRGFVRDHAPGLLGGIGPIEYWQVIGAIILVLGSALIGTLCARLIRRGTGRMVGEGAGQMRRFTWALAVTVALMLVAHFAQSLGAPEEMRRYTFPVLGIVLTLAGCVAIWDLLEVASTVLQRLSARSDIPTDDILIALILAAARLGVIVAGFLGVATFLSIPTGGILAGLGIGGLAFAFASRETLSNVFGAGILVADRPFRRGDWIVSGDIEGSVEHVGIRSTRVRTAQDSLVVVPNGKLSDSTINNLGTRRHRLVKLALQVTAGGTPETLGAFSAALRQRIVDDAAFVAERTDVGVSGITDAAIQVDATTYLNVSSTSAERAAKHGLLMDVLRIAEACGLKLGQGMQTGAPAEAAPEVVLHM
jgi:small-conductance mechanosensitive channel